MSERSRILIQNSEGKYLFCKNAGGKYFVLPGGKIDPGETPEEAALRECQEELNFTPVLKEKYEYMYERNGVPDRDYWFTIENSSDFEIEKLPFASHAFEIGEISWIGPEDTHIEYLPKDFFLKK